MLSVIFKTAMQEQSLDILVGEKLSSVTFVLDYLQVDFDGNQFTFYIWPTVFVDGEKYEFGEMFYRDKLCSLIAKVVVSATYVENDTLEINFGNSDKLKLSLESANPDIVAEIATFTDVDGKWYVFE
jgi:hypothetical protein